MYDVLVIGGGPAGLYAAYCLARAGRSVAVFEEHREIGMPVHCTGVLATGSFSRFTLPQDSIRAALRNARFHSPDGRFLSFASDQDEAVVVDRPSFDRGLADQAVEVGADLFLGHRIEALLRFPEGIVAHSSIADDGSRPIAGRLVILATGAAYHLHQSLGLGLPARFVRSAQVEVDFARLAEVEVYFGNEVAPGSFAWVVPFTRGGVPKAKIGLLSSRDAERYLARFLQSPMVAPRTLPNPQCAYRRRPVPIRPIPKTFAERVLVIGDAAGIVKPTTGGGIYYGLLTAELAAATATEAMNAGDFSARFLSRYQAAWQAALASEIRTGVLFRCFASQLSDAEIDEAFHMVASEQVGHLIRDHATFNWHKDVILALWRNANVRGFLWRSLVARGSRLVSPRLHRSDVAPAVRLSEEGSQIG
ncbi:MAG: NAD(P)/FAD-dependent oxidoreductase [candidate division NC10 bacterium]|nr:NAD(P)/FAD-dependent oxidoreductase [candidate division NC10 bacterium]